MTRHGEQVTTWVVVAAEVTVSYELTALTAQAAQADAGLRRFAAGYKEYLAHWEQAIAAMPDVD